MPKDKKKKYRIKYHIRGLKNAKKHYATEYANNKEAALRQFRRRKGITKGKHVVDSVNRLS